MVNEIKKEITDAYIADEDVIAAYGLQPGLTFDEQFSKVSIESIIFYIIATAFAGLRFLWEQYKIEVENRIKAAIPGTIAWYHNLVMSWTYNGERLLKFCAVTEQYPFLRIKVNTAEHGIIAQESDEMIALRSYLATNKFAGTQILLTSQQPETIELKMTIWLSAALYNSDGEKLATGEKSAEIAIDKYLSEIVYDGTFFKSRCVDAVQLVEGVNDVELLSAKIGVEELAATRRSQTGAFVANKNITYVLI